MTPSLREWIFDGRGRAAIAYVRVIVAIVFVSEGLQKFLFANELGVGRFAKIGIPAPEVMAPFVGGLEVMGGVALLVGLATRLLAIPLLISMIVAITSTKVAALPHVGVWKTLHEARTDMLMIGSLLFLLLVGSGRLSLDSRLAGRAHDDRRR